MSLSGSTSESYAKTGDGALRLNDAQPPTPTLENPGGVFPQSSGGPAPAGSMPGSGAPDHHGDVRGVFSNPEVFKDTFTTLSSAFTTAINAIEGESGSGQGVGAKALKNRLEAMRDEVDGWRMGKGLSEVEEAGGERSDAVEREGGGGLYKD